MKKTFLILTMLLASYQSAYAKCESAEELGPTFMRCENSEVICYGTGLNLDRGLQSGVSCFKK